MRGGAAAPFEVTNSDVRDAATGARCVSEVVIRGTRRLEKLTFYARPWPYTFDMLPQDVPKSTGWARGVRADTLHEATGGVKSISTLSEMAQNSFEKMQA